MINLDGKMEPEDIALCPLCDNAMLEWDETSVIECGGAKCLAHSDCIEELQA
jgi:hypothetical protein